MTDNQLTAILWIAALFVFIVVAVVVEENVRQILREEDISLGQFPAYLFERTKWEHKWLQRATTLIFTIVYMMGVYLIYQDSPEDNGIIVGSLLGAFPPIVGVLNEWASRPYVVVDDLRVIEYPEKWYLFGTEKSQEEAENAVCLRASIRNEGRKAAEDCQVFLQSDKIDNLRYHTRWSDGNPLTINLTPGETQEVDLLWIDSQNQVAKTARPYQDEDDEDHFPPGSYSMIKRHELAGQQKLDIVIDAANMPEKSRPVEINGTSSINLPEHLINVASEWEVITSLKDGEDAYVIKYNRLGTEYLEIPRDFDIDYLKSIDEFKQSEIPKDIRQTYEEAIEQVYTIVRD